MTRNGKAKLRINTDLTPRPPSRFGKGEQTSPPRVGEGAQLRCVGERSLALAQSITSRYARAAWRISGVSMQLTSRPAQTGGPVSQIHLSINPLLRVIDRIQQRVESREQTVIVLREPYRAGSPTQPEYRGTDRLSPSSAADASARAERTFVSAPGPAPLRPVQRVFARAAAPAPEPPPVPGGAVLQRVTSGRQRVEERPAPRPLSLPAAPGPVEPAYPVVPEIAPAAGPRREPRMVPRRAESNRPGVDQDEMVYESPLGMGVGRPAMTRPRPGGSLPPVDIERLTEQVIQQIDNRIVAHRERMGRNF